ncbi:hypothetical protein B7Y94_02790 [Candidatus Saccharibacteria bacterium 32-49-12]|nr:MAG: hypothetical protein B7Y94_02790 [Candidatus Saccharibacteria bacterium 32-49-12]
MIHKITILLASLLLVIGLSSVIFVDPASAVEGGAISGINSAQGDGVPTNFAGGDGSIVRRIINIMLYAIGVISVIMLIFGGFRYVISGGQKEAVTAAKNTILYAIVGLLVAIFAYAIVRFVIGAAIGTDSVTDI